MPTDLSDQLRAISRHASCASGIHPYLSRINDPAKALRRAGRVRQRRQARDGILFENFRIGDDLLTGREYFFDHFTAPDAHFFWCCRRAIQLALEISGFPNVAAHERPSVKKLLAYEKEVMKGLPRRPR